jgi:3-oxoadipate enol-lactonase
LREGEDKGKTTMLESSKLHTGFADVNGARLYYEVGGEGHPLLLLHAGIADSRMWDDQFSVFAQHYNVIRYDFRGFGKSAMPPGLFSSHQDVASLLNFLNVEKAYVIGQSFGGYIAIDFILTYPEMVDALILGAPNVSGYEPSSEEIQRFCAEEEEALNRGDLVAATAINRLDKIRVPTLLIVGDQDVPEFLKISDIVATGIPGAKRVVIPGVAHLPNMEKPEEFNRIVLDFLSERSIGSTE